MRRARACGPESGARASASVYSSSSCSTVVGGGALALAAAEPKPAARATAPFAHANVDCGGGAADASSPGFTTCSSSVACRSWRWVRWPQPEHVQRVVAVKPNRWCVSVSRSSRASSAASVPAGLPRMFASRRLSISISTSSCESCMSPIENRPERAARLTIARGASDDPAAAAYWVAKASSSQWAQPGC